MKKQKTPIHKRGLRENNNSRERESALDKIDNLKMNGRKTMASNKTLVPEAKQALEQFKMEAASEVGVTLNQGYNGDLTSRQAGSIGGQMVKKMIQKYENDLKTK